MFNFGHSLENEQFYKIYFVWSVPQLISEILQKFTATGTKLGQSTVCRGAISTA
jgi:hypothetical protein